MSHAVDHFPLEPNRRWRVVAAVIVGALAAHAITLRAMGRIWWCKCGRLTPWANAGEHNSQHLFDWYSPSHLLHGVIFYWLLRWPMGRASLATRLLIAALVEIAWEIVENTPWIIDRYRAQTTADSYYGDSVANSVSDVLCCVAGFLLARRIGWVGSIAVILFFELLTLYTIRDNLTLNVVMLLRPIDAIRHWQAGGK